MVKSSAQRVSEWRARQAKKGLVTVTVVVPDYKHEQLKKLARKWVKEHKPYEPDIKPVNKHKTK